MLLKDILDELDQIAPWVSAAEWDNVGLMVGDPDHQVLSVLLALDPSDEAIAFGREQAVDLIITHHPLIFRPLMNLDLQQGVGRKIAALLRAGISLVSMHTNLDLAPGGVADQLAAFVGLQDIQADGMLRFGQVPARSRLEEWVSSLSIDTARTVDAGRRVDRVAVCPGSGMDLWPQAREQGCDTFVTGDVRYHAARDALEGGLNIVDLGHFASEALILRPFARELMQKLDGMEVVVFEGQDVFKTINNKESEG